MVTSFRVNHNKLNEGMYVSRVDDDIITYDIRVIKPNAPPFLEPPAIHTIEHLFAMFVRTGFCGENVIYFGPMGCRTGFFFLLRAVSHTNAIALTKSAFEFISQFSGEIPGCRKEECGNFLEHNLDLAKEYASKMCKILANWVPCCLQYEQ
ncbi:MAG: S-ribosylhomocysteine lyase [Oscillospiraceae bacterium]|jgi:S-ribosylhomocysteine lyase|nr:S-ribosylhomocysteine lyase [Oscillospiraceae bacterium]